MIENFLFRFERGTEGPGADVLVAFVGSPTVNLAALRSAVEDELVNGLRPDDLIILLRAPHCPQVVAAFEDEGDLAVLLERLGGRTNVVVLSYDARGQEVGRVGVASGLAAATDVALPEIARRGITTVFQDRHGFVQSTGSYHFENPSKHHTSRFIRLSNILARQSEIAFIAACSLPFIKEGTSRIYIDTPSLYPIVASLNEQLASMSANHQFIPCDNFQSYDGYANYPFGMIDQSTVLISASSSGGLAAKLTAKKQFDPSRIAHILYLGDGAEQQNVVCDLSADEETNPDGYADAREVYDADTCPLCRSGSKFIRLQGDQFDIAGPQPLAVILRKTDAPKGHQAQMKWLGGKGILAAGRGEPAARLYDVQVPGLLEDSDFQERARYFTERYLPGRACAAVYVDAPSKDFAQWISTFGYKGSLALFDAADPDALKRHISAASGDRAVLVVGAVIGSGRAFQNVSRALRNVCPNSPLIYITGFSKPESDSHCDVLTKNLVETRSYARHGLVAVEQMNLLERRENPWNRETAWLGDAAFARLGEEASRLVSQRREILRRASEPLVDTLFLAADGTTILKAQKGFVFWPEKLLAKPEAHTQADIFYTISAVLQMLRCKPEVGDSRVLRTNWFQQTILDPENFGRFNDGAIQAALLRAALPSELDYSGHPAVSEDAARLIRRVLESSGGTRGEAAAEFLIAIGCQRLRLTPADRQKVLAPLENVPALIEGLRSVCASQRSNG
jgi:hypothetical protein